ncbi:hypothetical protein D1007_31117 [Hordeum vulgare]|nr:hypothetical protein D1007_31117 [Hordeum vulgare]
MCFDHYLKKLWDVSLGDDFPHAAHHREVTVSVTNYTLKHGEAGLFIVGGRMEMQHHLPLVPFLPRADLRQRATFLSHADNGHWLLPL